MSHYDDLPSRPRSHEVEEAAVVAFRALLAKSGAFVLQAADAKDYGTDCQIEVVDQAAPTNVRIHVQLKGTERAVNADGSVSIDVSRTNLNYLLAQPYSFYVCFHLPTESLRISLVEAVLRKYDHAGDDWTGQQTLTVSFVEELTVERLRRIAALTRSDAKSSRDRRLDQTRGAPSEVAGRVRRSVPEIHVPEDPVLAGQLLEKLYEQNADLVISRSFEKFAAVLGPESDAFGPAYMAETNLGMAKASLHPERIEASISYFRDKIDGGRYQPGSLAYTIGNAFSALGDEEEAKLAYQASLHDPGFRAMPRLAAQAHKNLGTSFERLGDQDRAVEHYQEALRLDPDLAESHHALGNYYAHHGRFDEALTHFDRVVFPDEDLGKALGVAGWRANVLFNLGDGRGAFREIFRLVSVADRFNWIWPWCARQVASFGRATPDNAAQAASFWERYIDAYPEHSAARREMLLAKFYLRGAGRDVGRSYADFREEFDSQIAHVDDSDAALPWDRLGHWAQDQGDWAEAERCFRKAYDLEGGHYGYCLGTALSFLDRYEEALPLLKEQAESLQPDATSWFQLGSAYANSGRPVEAIEAYEKALAIDRDHEQALFNLGGSHWNRGDHVKAIEIWKDALARFPDHDLAARLRRDMPTLFP
ncbi:MAG: tetratricopeptide repeat protein [Caulobacter sp.]|nr:tetratricopeptide repeat protein [Caulobacter sp.]